MANAIKVQRVGQQKIVYEAQKQSHEQIRSDVQYHLGSMNKTETSSKFEINSPVMQPALLNDDDMEGTVYDRNQSKMKNAKNDSSSPPINGGKMAGSNEDLLPLANDAASNKNQSPRQQQ